MRLLQCSDTDGYQLTKPFTNHEAIPPYAILSHTWGPDGDEVTFDDLINGTGTDKPGYEKIRFCAEQAKQDGLDLFWVDTCCIDKANKAELSQAINSMYRWYRNAARCYVYLLDVSTAKRRVNGDACEWEAAFRRSRWFTRGWTLQELLAPRVVEFFCRQRKRLGDTCSLRQQIHEITGIPEAALQGELLSQFSVNDRLSWIEHRETKREEDKAYSLLGIFGVYMPPIYGEGIGRAFSRLRDEIRKLEECTRDLHITDPRRDKARIEEIKGGLLEESYRWIFQNPEFLHWRNDPQSRLLWIKGDPGKGKTMLLCGIINELRKSTAKTFILSYFFCQAADSRINNATAVLRGLLFMLVNQQPSLISHLRKKYDQTGKALFEDANAWVVLCEIFIDILQDSTLDGAYFFIDALDECVKDLEKLLAFIIQNSSLCSRVKWILTSRNYTNIEQRLRLDDSGARLSLELKANATQVSCAVNAYINHRLTELEQIQNDQSFQLLVREKMQQKANGTFLWVSLVMKELRDVQSWEVLQVVEEVPTELKDVYWRMMGHIKQLKRQNPELCRQVLSTVIATHRPLHLQELCVLADLPTQGHNIEKTTAAIVNMCGSFLTLREDYVYVVHQSAKDFLLDEAGPSVFLFGKGEVHRQILSRSIQVMSRTLQRDMYRLDALGYPIEQVRQPKPDPLAASWYSCIYWIDHLYDWMATSSTYDKDVLQSGGSVDSFLRKKCLYWFEALSLCKSISKGVVSMAKLEALTDKRAAASSTIEIVRDSNRFIMYHKSAIESSPLQVYGALLFSPTRSIIRTLFKDEEPEGIVIRPGMQDCWSNCLQTLEGHSSYVNSVAFSHDSTQLASASDDGTVKVWDARSGECLLTLEDHSSYINSVAFSRDSTRLASGSYDDTVSVWDAYSGECLLTLAGHSDSVTSVAYSHDSTWLASGSDDGTVNVWDAHSGECLLTLAGHSDSVSSVAFSHDSTQLASGSRDGTVKVWDAHSSECLLTLAGHRNFVTSVAFSHDSTRLASGSHDGTVKVWDAGSSECIQTIEDNGNIARSVAFSHDSTRLVTGSGHGTVKIWDARSGEYLLMLKGHSDLVDSVAFSHDSTRLVSASWDCTIKVWDAHGGDYLSALDEHTASIWRVAFSHDSALLASASVDGTVKVWDTRSGDCLLTLKDHHRGVRWIDFSHNSTRLASASEDATVKVCDTSSGECLSTLEGHSSTVTSVAFSHDSTRVVSGSVDRTVRVWDAHSSECLLTLKGHCNKIWCVAFSYDSTQLASTSRDRTVKLWDAHSGECLSTLEGHSSDISLVVFSHNSTLLASTSIDGAIKVWDAHSSKCLTTIHVETRLHSISFDPSNEYLHTDIGAINISGLPSPAPTLISTKPHTTQYQGLALSAAGLWITYSLENLLRLPSDYRPSCSAVSGNVFAIGVGSGRVWMCDVRSCGQCTR